MNGNEARKLLNSLRVKYNPQRAFYMAASQARMTASDFGKLLHKKEEEPVAEEKQMEMF